MADSDKYVAVGFAAGFVALLYWWNTPSVYRDLRTPNIKPTPQQEYDAQRIMDELETRRFRRSLGLKD